MSAAVPRTAEQQGSADEFDADVLVVGAGPIGLTSAALLSAYGVQVMVVERNFSTSNEPKAISLDDESLRTFAAAGLIDSVLPIITPGTGTRYYGMDGEPLFQARAEVPYRLGYPFKNPFAQPDLERVLSKVISDSPLVQMYFGTEFTDLAQDEDGVTVTLADSSGPRNVRVKYVLGCDGGRSPVRQRIGVTMIGRSHVDVWLVADTLNDPHTERFGMHHGDPARPVVIIPGRGGRCRYEFMLHPGEGEAGDQVPFDLIKQLLARYREIAPEDVERAVNYRFHGLVADAFGVGRVFLLGDSAHMMPPFAGQGLNSGMRDAANLMWKIADVLAGRMASTALQTYQIERQAHAAATVRLSERLGRVVMTTSPRVAAYRDRVVGQAMQTESGRAFFEEMQYRPKMTIKDGMCVADTVGAGDVLGQPRVFDPVRHRQLMLDEVLGNRWAVLGVDVTGSDWRQPFPATVAALSPRAAAINVGDHLPYEQPGRQVGIDIDGSLERELAHLKGRFVLVRPDRFIAASWAPGDIKHVDDVMTAFVTHPQSMSQNTAK